MKKQWYMSKTIWAGIIIAGYGILSACGVNLPTELIVTLSTALGVVGMRQALSN